MRQSLCLCINLVLLLSVNFVSTCQDGECRMLAFPSFLLFADKRLLNHTIRTEQVKDLSLCELLCYHEPNCVSVNFKTTENAEGTFSCELNNSTHRRHDDEFMDNCGYLFREAESACDADPCENDATCQAGYTQKKYRCLCLSGFTGENCENDAEKVYHVTVRTTSGSFSIPLPGTNANVWIKVLGTKGSTDKIQLDHPGDDEFTGGRTDLFTFETYHVGTITGVEVYRDDRKAWSWDSPNWHLNYIAIDGQYFYFNQWIEKNTWVRR